jgi:hypothetical protein
MAQEKVIAERQTIRTFLEQLATYVSLFTPLLTALIAWQGLKETKYIFLFYAVLPLVLGATWLRSQYRVAKTKIKKEGIVQQPAWLWKLITNKIPHKSEQLLDSQVMVFVPPSKEEHALRLHEEYNNDGNHILLFHYIPEPIDNFVDEDQGRVSFNGEVRSLETLAEEMNECAALILLDDIKWEQKYGRTLLLVEEWTKRHTVRPVMSVRLDGRGTLNYSWSHIEEIVNPNHSLKNKLLAQSTNRGAKWFWQARLYRRIVLWTLGLALIFSMASFLISYRWQHNAKTAEQEATTKVQVLEAEVEKFNKLIYSDPSSQQEISRAFEHFRADLQIPEAERLRQLLQVYANQIKLTLVGASNQTEAVSGNVIMFSVKKMAGDKEWRIQEVAATRIPPNRKSFLVKLRGENETSDILGLVSCSVASRAFILWSGDWKGNDVKTTNIEAWDLQGNKIGYFDGESISIKNNRCKYQPRIIEDLHRRILCAPAGLDLNSNEISPAGAICIEYTEGLKFLNEPWVRQTIIRYGSSLSFESWDKALLGESNQNGLNPAKRKQ